MKKTISILLLTAILASMAACGSTGSPDDTSEKNDISTSEAVSEKPTDGLPDKNMEGFELKILHNSADSLTWVNVQLDAESENGDLANDAIYKRNTYIEDRFKCILTYEEQKGSDIVNQYSNLVMSGDNPYDIIMVYGIEAIKHIDNYADIGALPYLKLDAEWWNPEATGVFNIGGKQTTAAGSFSLSYVSTANCLLFNKRIYSDMNTGESLYDLVDSGRWTIDKFFEVAASAVRDLNGDSKMDGSDIWGSNGTPKSFHHMLVIGSDQHYVTKDKDGYPVFNAAKDEKLINFFEKIINYEKKSPYAYALSTDVNNATTEVNFRNGGCLFEVTWGHHIANYRDMQDDFGIIPAPKYDESQDKYYANMANGEVMTLPRSYDSNRAENIGMLLEAMSFYTYNEVLPVYKNELLSTKVARDEDSSRMLDLIFDGVVYDFGINVWQDNLGNNIIKQIFIPQSDAIVSTLDTLSNSVDTDIKKLRESIEAMP